VAGYSATPLAKKLGIKEQTSIAVVDAPKGYRGLLDPLPAAVRFSSNIDATTDIVHVFITKKSELARALASYRKELALPLGFVDIKVCAVDEVWSGLKLVVRKELR
jgi:hypothetical protein